ncbi:hypothetical protein ACQEVZ_03810 [Dactylosporangium sp. CA-152071]
MTVIQALAEYLGRCLQVDVNGHLSSSPEKHSQVSVGIRRAE